jgi:hypothetical protein
VNVAILLCFNHDTRSEKGFVSSCNKTGNAALQECAFRFGMQSGSSPDVAVGQLHLPQDVSQLKISAPKYIADYLKKPLPNITSVMILSNACSTHTSRDEL